MKPTPTTRLGIIGGGLMGRELASAAARFFVIKDLPLRPEITAVCDISEQALSWFRGLGTVSCLTTDYRELLARPEIDAVYLAVPHRDHLEVGLAVLRAGKDLLSEKPFGIDLAAARALQQEAVRLGRFVRVSSEMPFFPGAQRTYDFIRSGRLGRVLQVRAGFLHASDLDPDKPINWKRQASICGELGVMGDLGMHVLHLPLRLGWKPARVFAQLQKIYPQRPDGKGGMAPCDTWDNAWLHTDVLIGGESVPMDLEMKRLAPGEKNTWFIEVLGTDGGAAFSTKFPKTFRYFTRQPEQVWHTVDLGFETPFSTITGGIFEPGFPDCLQQMLAAFLAERAGLLGERFGCARPEEAVASHELFAAALRSQCARGAIELAPEEARAAVR